MGKSLHRSGYHRPLVWALGWVLWVGGPGPWVGGGAEGFGSLGPWGLQPAVAAKKSEDEKDKKKKKKKKSKQARKKKAKAKSIKNKVRQRMKKSRSTSSKKKAAKQGQVERGTGVKSIRRRDGGQKSEAQHESDAQDRWESTGQRTRRRVHRSSRIHRPRLRRQVGHSPRRTRQLGASHQVPVTAAAAATPQETAGAAVQGQGQSQGAGEVPGQAQPLGPPLQEAQAEIPMGAFLGYSVELSTSIWGFNGAHLKPSHSDWSEAVTRATYQVESEQYYKLSLSLATEWTDLYVGYETSRGFAFADGGGSLLDLVLVVPGLERLSTWYRRVRFEYGEVELRDDEEWIESQAFRFEIDEVGLQFAVIDHAPVAISLLGRFQRRAMPRQIYLQESHDVTLVDDDGNEEAITEHFFFDISEQLLWVPIEAYEFGLRVDVKPQESGLHIHGELLAGLGHYELQTPLGGERVDEGLLGTVDVGLGIDYLLPLNDAVALTFGYGLQLYFPAPMGLSDDLKDEHAAEGDVSDFSLSFAAMDVLQRLTAGLVLTF